MATALSTKQPPQKNITCSICTEILKQPQALTCLHNFCRKCLKNVDRRAEGGRRGISCPICKQFTEEKDIVANTIMEKLVELLEDFYKENIMNRTDITDKFCVQCNRSKVTSFCVECRFDLCDVCNVTHLRMPTCGDHQIVPIKEANTHPVINIVKYCPDHPSKAIKLSCIPCVKAICTECKYQRHDTHKTESIESAMEKILPEVKQQLQTLKSVNNTTAKNKDFLVSKVRQMQDNMGSILRNVIEEKEIKKAQLDKDCEVLEEILVNHEQAIVKEGQLLEEDMNNLMSSVESVLSWAQMLVDIAQGPAVLYELQNELMDKIRGLITESKPSPSFNVVTEKATQMVHFKPADKAGGNAIGHLNFTRTPIEGGYVIQDVKQEISADEGPIVEAAISVKSFRQYNCLTTLTLKKMKKNFKLQRPGVKFCLYEDELWFPSYDDNKIDIYNKSVQYLRSTQCNGVKNIRMLHPFRQNKMLLAGDSGLYIMDINQENVSMKLKPGDFVGVHAHSCTIVALDLGKRKNNTHDEVHIFQSSDPPTFMNTIKLHGGYTAVAVVSFDKIYISFLDKKASVSIYSLSGECLATYGRRGCSTVNELEYPLLRAFDKDGNVLIVESSNKRLQILTPEGQFILIKDVNLSYMYDVLITDGHLYVLYKERNEMFVQMYEV